MEKFEFSSNLISLCIAGHLYEIEYNDESAAAVYRLALVMVEQGKKMEKQEATSVKNFKEATQSIYEQIDEVLGSGASAAIFANRKSSYLDASAVAMHIVYQFRNLEKLSIEKIVKSTEMKNESSNGQPS